MKYVLRIIVLGGLGKIAIENRQRIVPEIMDLLCGLLEEKRSPNSKGIKLVSYAKCSRFSATMPMVFERPCTVADRICDWRNKKHDTL